MNLRLWRSFLSIFFQKNLDFFSFKAISAILKNEKFEGKTSIDYQLVIVKNRSNTVAISTFLTQITSHKSLSSNEPYREPVLTIFDHFEGFQPIIREPKHLFFLSLFATYSVRNTPTTITLCRGVMGLVFFPGQKNKQKGTEKPRELIWGKVEWAGWGLNVRYRLL